ncbi:MAG TPA: hypothetical protein VN873_18895 [Candidatus Angelobacter sp.]|nr:hypothetical protein [Candidatus Angelobacter sp.]
MDFIFSLVFFWWFILTSRIKKEAAGQGEAGNSKSKEEPILHVVYFIPATQDSRQKQPLPKVA